MLFVYSDRYKCRLDLGGETCPMSIFLVATLGLGRLFVFRKGESKMSIIKPIKCPKGRKPFDGCGSVCVEVGHSIGYPKGLYDHPRKIYHEYRFVCPKCGKEWIYDTAERGIFRVRKTSQFKIRLKNNEEIIKANPKHPSYQESLKFLNQILRSERS